MYNQQKLKKILGVTDLSDLNLHELLKLNNENIIEELNMDSFESNIIVDYLIKNYKKSAFKHTSNNFDKSFKLQILDEEKIFNLDIFKSKNFVVEVINNDKEKSFMKKIISNYDSKYTLYQLTYSENNHIDWQFSCFKDKSNDNVLVDFDEKSSNREVYQYISEELKKKNFLNNDMFDILSIKFDYKNEFLKFCLSNVFDKKNKLESKITMKNKI